MGARNPRIFAWKGQKKGGSIFLIMLVRLQLLVFVIITKMSSDW